jgi:hypothetical protein
LFWIFHNDFCNLQLKSSHRHGLENVQAYLVDIYVGLAKLRSDSEQNFSSKNEK